MSLSHPFAAAGAAQVSAPAADARADTVRLNRVAFGQRTVVVSLVGLVAGATLAGAAGSLAAILMLVSYLLGAAGVANLSSALGDGRALRLVFTALALVPLAGVLGMLVLSLRATRALRARGYRVGLLGADPR